MAKDDADVVGVLVAVFVWVEIEDADMSLGGIEDSGEELDGGGFSGAVWAYVANEFALVDGEVDVFDDVHSEGFAIEERFPASFAFGGDGEGFGDVVDLDDWVWHF